MQFRRAAKRDIRKLLYNISRLGLMHLKDSAMLLRWKRAPREGAYDNDKTIEASLGALCIMD
eukprot:scaffold5978_cov157-Amphora_coffeaeformis.AAC.2